MTRTIGGGVAVCFVLACATLASAQDQQRPALVISYPTTVGVLLPVGGSWAVRPEFSFSTHSSDSGLSSGSSDTWWSVGTGVSLLYYLHEADGLRTYVTPRVIYSRSSFGTRSGSSASDTISSWDVVGSFGAQYALGRRFGVFGEVGLAYSRTTASGIPPYFPDSHSREVGTNAVVGVLVGW